MKKTVVAAGILATSLVAYFAVNQNEFVPAPITFNGQVIEMTHTDDNSKEDLIIYTDKATYSSWDSADVIFSVTNLSSKDQNVKARLLFGKDEQTAEIKEFIPQVPYTVTIEDYATEETCEMVYSDAQKKEVENCYRKKIGSHEETRYRDMWVNLAHTKGQKPSDYANQERINKVIDSKYKTDHESTVYLKSGETKYFKAVVKFTPPVFKDGVQEPPTEFYVEATGDQGAYGILDPWYSGSWTYRKQIDINPNYVPGSADLTDFPYLVDITDANLASNAQADGDDILFTSSDGTTKIDHEIEIYTSSTGRLTAWVEVPTLSYNATTTLYMYYGNSGATNQQNVNGTWNSGFKGVWHLGQDPAASSPQFTDSTSNANNGASEFGGPPQVTNGKIYRESSFASTSQKDIVVSDAASLDTTTDATLCAWIYPRFWQSAAYSTVVGKAGNYLLQITPTGSAPGNTLVGLWDDNTNLTYLNVASFPTVNTYSHVCMVVTSNALTRLMVNGSNVDTTSTIWFGRARDLTQPFYMGSRATSNGYEGNIDEVRFSNVARSADWITTEYNNQSATSTFQIFGAQETDTGGGAVNVTSDLIIFD